MSIPYVPSGTSKRFRVPRTLAADFDAFLDRDIPNTNMDFELLHNWYDKFQVGYTPYYVRGEIYPDSTKSRYENTDNNMNIRCSLTSGIRKGDIVIEPDHTIFLLDWDGHKESNNIPSRALRCNLYLEVKRLYDQEEDVDEDGFVIKSGNNFSGEDFTYYDDKPYETLVPRIPCNAYRYDGRPEFVAISSTPGTIANALTLLTVQYNDVTKQIHINDIFDWGEETYEIVDVNRVGVDIRGHYGTLKLQAKKKAGGLHGY